MFLQIFRKTKRLQKFFEELSEAENPGEVSVPTIQSSLLLGFFSKKYLQSAAL